ncbi:MAG: UbiD family decarboxylase [Chloroflexi bacterium]|nr:UbiD family decarboxylase [Chloroflexota bacterium]
MAYADLREFVAALEAKGLLRHVKAEVDKNWEISSVMRWIYRGYPEDDRFAVIFDRVKGHNHPVLAGAIGASYKTYALSLGIDPGGRRDEVIARIRERWGAALEHPIAPKTVKKGPCKQNILKGEKINLHRFPVPVWTPEKDAGSELGLGFLTSPYHVSKDPDTGIRNVGTYRSMLRKQPNEMGIMVTSTAHIRAHIRKNEARGKATEVATVIGCDPAVGIASVTRVPTGVDELSIAGGLRGSPVALVKCETVDLEVPATAEIVIEGRLPPPQERAYEAEGPFGEGVGYQGDAKFSPVYEITCITYRNDAIYQAFVSQMPPSESSKLRQLGHEALLLRQLAGIGIEGVVDVHVPEMTQMGVIIASIKKSGANHPARVASAIASIYSRLSKFLIVTDEDIDIRDLEMVWWAMVCRTSMAPTRRGVHFMEGFTASSLDYSSSPSLKEHMENKRPDFAWPQDLVFIDATRPYTPYPVLSLPPAKYLEKARDGWKKYGLPELANGELLKCILLEEDYLKRGIAVKP